MGLGLALSIAIEGRADARNLRIVKAPLLARIFALAQRFNIDIDFHLDFGLDTTHLDVLEVCRLADLMRGGAAEIRRRAA